MSRFASPAKRAAWVPLFVVLAASAIAKCFSDGGTAPKALDAGPFGNRVVLGAATTLELGIAMLLWFPRTRAFAAVLSGGITIVYAILIGSSTSDFPFLANCPCFGGARLFPGGSSFFDGIYHVGVLALCTCGTLWSCGLRGLSMLQVLAVGLLLNSATRDIGVGVTRQVQEEGARLSDFIGGDLVVGETDGSGIVQALTGGDRVALSQYVKMSKPDFVVLLAAGCAACARITSHWSESGSSDDPRRIYVILGDADNARRFAEAGHLPLKQCFSTETPRTFANLGVLGVPRTLRCSDGRIVDPRGRDTLLGALGTVNCPEKLAGWGGAAEVIRSATGASHITVRARTSDMLVADVIISGSSYRSAWVVGRVEGIPMVELIVLFQQDATIASIVPLSLDFFLLGQGIELMPLSAFCGRSAKAAVLVVRDWEQVDSSTGTLDALAKALKLASSCCN